MNALKMISGLSALILLSISLCPQENVIISTSGPYLGQNPPGEIPEIFAKDIVSTSMYNHCNINISPSGDEIYWAMAPLDEPKKIYFSQNVDGCWTKPAITHFTRFEDGDCPVISPDGTKMYFNSGRSLNNSEIRRERVWYVRRIDNDWGNPYPHGKEINGSHLHWQVSIDNHGNLYFGSERKGSKGKDDIFKAEYFNGYYKKPVSLGNHINSVDHESTPFIAPNGEYIIFCRDGLRICFMVKDGNWSESVSLGESFNGSCPYVSPDGKYLFFLKMGKGYNDVYWVSANIIDKKRKEVLKIYLNHDE